MKKGIPRPARAKMPPGESGPVTIGNILGGTVLVGLVYWFIYLRPPSEPKTED